MPGGAEGEPKPPAPIRLKGPGGAERQPHAFHSDSNFEAPPDLMEPPPPKASTPKFGKFYTLLIEKAESGQLSEDDIDKLEKLTTSRTGGHDERKRWKQELIRNHPEVYLKSKSDKRCKGEEGTKKGYNRTSPLYHGDKKHMRDNIQPLFPKKLFPDRNLPLKMGFMVTNLPVSIMIGLLGQYGTKGAQEVILGGTESKSVSEAIVLSSEDGALIQSYTEKASSRFSNNSQEMDKAKDEVLHNAKLYAMATSDREYSDKQIDERAERCLQAAIQSNEWKEAATLKDYQASLITIIEREKVQDYVYAYTEFMRVFKLDLWSFRQFRTRYYMHHWGIAALARFGKLECSQVVDKNISPLDCQYMNSQGVTAHDTLDHLVRACLELVFKQEKVDDQVAVDNEEEEDAEVAKNKNNRGRNKDKLASYKSWKDMKKGMAYFPGILKTGSRATHQRLHIDNADLLGSVFLNQTLSGNFDAVTDKEWLSAGYVIDLPLSREGSWLRVAIPDPANKVFLLDYVHIPFGSFLVRSAALFHSGHYGSPGNTRVHALMFLKGACTNTHDLGYITKVTDQKATKSVAKDWGVCWSSAVINANGKAKGKTLKTVASEVPNYTNKYISNQKRSGTNYYKLIRDNHHSALPHQLWLVNPTFPQPSDDNEEDQEEGADESESEEEENQVDTNGGPRKRQKGDGTTCEQGDGAPEPPDDDEGDEGDEIGDALSLMEDGDPLSLMEDDEGDEIDEDGDAVAQLEDDEGGGERDEDGDDDHVAVL